VNANYCFVLSLHHWLIGALAFSSVAARSSVDEFTRNETYCFASAVFVGVATKVYFRDRPDSDTCEDPAPRTVAQFANQGMICYPLIVEVEVQEYLYTEEKQRRSKYKLHMKWALPEFRADSIDNMGQRLRSSPHIYSVLFIKELEEQGATWLLGHPRSIEERDYVLGGGKTPPCSGAQ
jgi:hypothetical protein